MVSCRGLSNLWLVLCTLVLVNACNSRPSPAAEEVLTSTSRPAVGEHTWTTPDGNRIPYSVAGRSDAAVTVVLVHCWMCDRSFWDSQLPALSGAYRTVTLDMPGHGAATSEREAWSVSGYGEDVAGLIRELGLQDVVLVGHSMGGHVTLRASALLPGIVRGIVAVDTLHDAEFKFEGEPIEELLQAFETDFVGTCENFVSQMFPEDDVEPIGERGQRAGCEAGRSDVGTALLRNFSEIEGPAWFREAGVPIRAINAAEPTPTRIEVNRRYADFDAVLMDGVGHYLHMTRPATFNPLLLEAISAFVGPSS